MANIKISQLTAAASLTGTETLPIVQSGSTVKTTAQDIANLAAGIGGTNYVFVAANGTDVENAAELQAAYNLAQTMSPSATNRLTVIAAPGNYDFGTSQFLMDAPYIDLVSLDGNRSIIFNHTFDGVSYTNGSIFVLTFDTYVKGVDCGEKTFSVLGGSNTIIENCKGGQDSFSSNGVFILSGTFINCEGGNFSFGKVSTAIIPGTFINCKAGDSSFGNPSLGIGPILSGVFTNCTAGSNSFGLYGNAAGTFTNCVGGPNSFASLSGILLYSRVTSNSLPDSNTLTASGGVIAGCIEGNTEFITRRP